VRAESGDPFELGDHACWIFDDDDACLAGVAGFVAAGLRQRQRVLYLTAALLPAAVLAGLEARGVPALEATRTGRLEVRPADGAYLLSGRFDPAGTLDRLAGDVDDAIAAGHAGLRVVGDMAWALGAPPGIGALPWYEARFNRLFLQGRAVAVCLYDRRSFGVDLLRRVACAHPGSRPATADAGWRPVLRMRRSAAGVRIEGEADAANRQAVSAALAVAVDDSRSTGAPAVLDLAAMTFLDAGTAGLLARAAATAPHGLALSGCSPAVTRVLGLIGAELAGADPVGTGPAGAGRPVRITVTPAAAPEPAAGPIPARPVP
jgi:anti-anti-sigma regulatory factor